MRDLAHTSLITITDYSKDEWLHILALAKKFEKTPPGALLNGQIVASLFYEPSTRTRLSFESAVQRLGGSVIGIADARSSSVAKGETLKDTIRTISSYVDLIVIRHPLEGSARLAAEYASVPVINAGDGANQHPSQTLLDLYSMQKTQNKLDDLTVTFVGDLKYGRTVHSLAEALSHFRTRIKFVSPIELKIPEGLRHNLKRQKVDFEEISSIEKAITNSDVLYVTRIQKERFGDPVDYERVRRSFVLTPLILENAPKNLRVMHPLPRVNEIDEAVDIDERAYYFEQVRNGVFVRQAIMACILGVAS